MASLWNLLFKRPRQRTYVRLDNHGRCLAFKQCNARPAAGNWVRVREIRLAWLGQALPMSARIDHSSRNRWQPRSLPA